MSLFLEANFFFEIYFWYKKNKKKAGECCQADSIENFVEKLGNDASKMVGFFIEETAR